MIYLRNIAIQSMPKTYNTVNNSSKQKRVKQTQHTPQVFKLNRQLSSNTHTRQMSPNASNSIVTWIAFWIITLNAVVRSICPSIYVPAQKTCLEWYGSPFVARTIATVAEFFFYRQVAHTLCITDSWWYTDSVHSPLSSCFSNVGWSYAGVLFWIWLIGETLSWIGLCFQNSNANALEDTVWCIWFIVAFCLSNHWSRFILVPIVLYYILIHLPSLIPTLDWNNPFALHPVSNVQYVPTLDKHGDWVVPSVCAKWALFIIFVYVEKYTT